MSQPHSPSRGATDPGAGSGIGGRRARVVDAAVGAVVASILLAGMWRPGYPLLRDMVSTPRPALGDAALGLSGSAARAVPQDVVLAVGARALDAVGVTDSVLIPVLTAVMAVWTAVGAGALVRRAWPGAGPAMRVPAIVVALWNPWVVERLLQGHWSLLAGLAACVSIPAILLRRCGPDGSLPTRPAGAASTRPAWPAVGATAAALAAAGITPTGWVAAVLCLIVCVVAGRGHRWGVLRPAVLALAALLAAAPWLTATAVSGVAGPVGADAGVAAFAARAEPGVGTAGATFTLGGIWNSQAVPFSRTTWWVPPALVLWALMWGLAAGRLWAVRRSPAVAATVALGVGAWAAVTLAATGPGIAVLQLLVTHLPGAGLLRDTQKFLMSAVPMTALAAAAASRALAAAATRGPAGTGVTGFRRVLAASAVVVVAVASVPDGPIELWRQLEPTRYGAGWERVREITASSPGRVMVLPAGMIRSTPLFAGGRPVLDPAPRMLDAPVAASGDLVVGGSGVGGTPVVAAGEATEDRRSYGLLLAGSDCRELTGRGVRWVLDERTSSGPRGRARDTLARAQVRYRDDELVLYELPGPVGGGRSSTAAERSAVWAAHAGWLSVLVIGAVSAVRPRRRAVPTPGR